MLVGQTKYKANFLLNFLIYLYWFYVKKNKRKQFKAISIANFIVYLYKSNIMEHV